jgi:hypothetical protein
MDFPTHPDHDTGVESLDMDMVHDFGGQVEGLDMRDFQTTEVDDGLDDKGHLGESDTSGTQASASAMRSKL